MNKPLAGRLTITSLVINQRRKIFLVGFLLLTLFLVFKGIPVTSWGPSGNNENVSVHTTVNITNAYPEILNISCNNGAAITLTAGSTETVDCLVEIQDYNGWDDVNAVNGTFYYYLNESSDPDNNNSHYTNSSCTQGGNDGQYLVNWTCSFDVWYYAVNGTWEANITVNDSFSATDNDYGNATISALLALNVTDVIDFGDIPVTNTSDLIEANVTNFGNIPLNVSVYGFGGEDEVLYAGLAMVCDQRNISLPNERYSLNSTALYDDMTPVNGSPVIIPALTVEKQTQPGVYVINSTYWRLHINLTTNPFGICNGTVVFAAESP